jgi:hypothetical protein
MFEAPGSAPVAAAQSVAVAIFFLGFGYLVADASIGRRVPGIVTLGLAVPGLAGFALLLTGAHVLLGGAVFREAWVTRTVVLVSFAVLLGRRITTRTDRASMPASWMWVAIGAAILGAAVWSLPVVSDLPVGSRGDVVLHTGYTNQLLGGERLPTSAVTGDVPNFYPWLSHSLTALIARFTPGGNAFHALGPLQMVQAAGVMLGLVALGSRLGDERTAAAAGLLGGLTGGFGFVLLRSIDVVERIHEEPELYMGDLLVRRSYNLSLFNLPPPFPRDVAFVLLIGAILALVVGLKQEDRRALVVAGFALGLSGLIGAEAFFVGVACGSVLGIFPPAGVARRTMLWFLIPAIGVYMFWVVPQAIAWVSLGGFVNITRVPLVTLSAPAILVAWGVVTPLAIIGAVAVYRSRLAERSSHVVLALVVAALLGIVSASFLSSLFGEAFDAIGRPHRYWPLLYLGLALLGAIGLTRSLDLVAGRARWMAGVTAVVVVGLALPSPLIASIAYAREKETPSLVESAVRGDPDSLLDVLAASGDRCDVAAPARPRLYIWDYTGFHLVLFKWPGYEENLARIRWADIYERIPGDEERIAANKVLLAGADVERWNELVDRFGVDVIVTHRRNAEAPAFRSFPARRVDPPDFVVIQVSECEPG